MYAVALSGGADSLAAAALMPPGLALIVDHGLRPNSAREATVAAAQAAALGHQPHIIPLRWDTPPRTQALYRHARYRALALACARHGVRQLWTGHHRDDQGETLWLRLSHGSGLMGLMGMPFARPFGPAWLVRPLLNVRRGQIEAFLSKRGVAWARDPSNADPRYPRTLARQWLHARPESADRLIDLAARITHLRADALKSAARIPIKTPALGLITLPRSQVCALSDAPLAELLRACVQWVGGQSYPSLGAHMALVRQGATGQRSSGGGAVMELGADIRLAPENRQARGLSLPDLAALAAGQRAIESVDGLWLPQGSGALPFVPVVPQLGFDAAKAPLSPLQTGHRIEVFSPPPM